MPHPAIEKMPRSRLIFGIRSTLAVGLRWGLRRGEEFEACSGSPSRVGGQVEMQRRLIRYVSIWSIIDAEEAYQILTLLSLFTRMMGYPASTQRKG